MSIDICWVIFAESCQLYLAVLPLYMGWFATFSLSLPIFVSPGFTPYRVHLISLKGHYHDLRVFVLRGHIWRSGKAVDHNLSYSATVPFKTVKPVFSDSCVNVIVDDLQRNRRWAFVQLGSVRLSKHGKKGRHSGHQNMVRRVGIVGIKTW